MHELLLNATGVFVRVIGFMFRMLSGLVNALFEKVFEEFLFSLVEWVVKLPGRLCSACATLSSRLGYGRFARSEIMTPSASVNSLRVSPIFHALRFYLKETGTVLLGIVSLPILLLLALLFGPARVAALLSSLPSGKGSKALIRQTS